MNFDQAYAQVKTLLAEEIPEGAMHAMWIRSKQNALSKIKSEADLAPDTTESSGVFDEHHDVSKLIRSFMKNGK